jgi:acetate kinase
MPDYAYMYAIPHELYEKYGVRRYGFHGTSHRYVSKRVCEFLGVNPVGQKIITCHIGNGGSIACIKVSKYLVSNYIRIGIPLSIGRQGRVGYF